MTESLFRSAKAAVCDFESTVTPLTPFNAFR